MRLNGPSFSPYPVGQLRKLDRRDAAIESLIARWIAARPLGTKLAALVGGPVRARLIGVVHGPGHPDPHAAFAEVRIAGTPFLVAAPAQPIRALAQRMLGGPAELAAARPLSVAEHAIWALALAAAIDDLQISAEVWPLEGVLGELDRPAGSLIAFAVDAPTLAPAITVTAVCPPELLVCVPPQRPLHAWPFDLPVIIGRCALSRDMVRELAVRDVITLERHFELVIGGGGIGLTAAPGAVEAKVATEYVPRDMALPDDAHFEVTVQLGTTRMTLRELGELAVGEIIPLGRPLAGPFEVRAQGRLVGQGELVDIDGELGVRIVSIGPPDGARADHVSKQESQ